MFMFYFCCYFLQLSVCYVIYSLFAGCVADMNLQLNLELSGQAVEMYLKCEAAVCQHQQGKKQSHLMNVLKSLAFQCNEEPKVG